MMKGIFAITGMAILLALSTALAESKEIEKKSCCSSDCCSPTCCVEKEDCCPPNCCS